MPNMLRSNFYSAVTKALNGCDNAVNRMLLGISIIELNNRDAGRNTSKQKRQVSNLPKMQLRPAADFLTDEESLTYYPAVFPLSALPISMRNSPIFFRINTGIRITITVNIVPIQDGRPK